MCRISRQELRERVDSDSGYSSGAGNFAVMNGGLLAASIEGEGKECANIGA